MDPVVELRYALDTFYLLLSGALVMWMAAGFAMLESGLVRAKNTAETRSSNSSRWKHLPRGASIRSIEKRSSEGATPTSPAIISRFAASFANIRFRNAAEPVSNATKLHAIHSGAGGPAPKGLYAANARDH
jgi:hypothetical protein